MPDAMDVVQRHGAPVVLSGSDTPRTHAAYAGFTFHYTHTHYSIAAKGGSRGNAGEIIATLSAPGVCTQEAA